MVRNVDGMIFGEHRARAAIDLPTSLTSRGGPEIQEGARGDRRTTRSTPTTCTSPRACATTSGRRRSSPTWSTLGALTVGDRDHPRDRADAGTSWARPGTPAPGWCGRRSPTCGCTARPPASPTPSTSGCRWRSAPTGCRPGRLSLLAEMKVARQELVEQGHPITAKDLVTMVTSGAAEVAGLGGKLGRLEVGRVADLVVLAPPGRRRLRVGVCDSTPADVELVMIGGDVAYGRTGLGALARCRPDGPRPRAGRRVGPADAAGHQLRGEPGRRARRRGCRRSGGR